MIRNRMKRRFKVIRLAIRLFRLYRQIGRLMQRDETGQTAQIEALYTRAGREFRETAEQLCGAIVKAGQFLSLRQELFPPAFTRELERLQDEAPPVPFNEIRASMKLFGEHGIDEVFSMMDNNPLAAASVAQVHRAQLRTGETVAVKVLRPGIERLVKVDMTMLRYITRVLSILPGVSKRMDFVLLHREFADTLAKELDMRLEAQHIHRFQRLIVNGLRIVIPTVYDLYTTKHVLVMSYMSGANVRDYAKLADWNIDTRMVRDTLLDAYLQQILECGFVHLDPHPGNLIVLSDGRLGIIDFGMMGEYSASERDAFKRLMQHIMFRNAEGVAGALRDLGYMQPNANFAEFVQVIGSLLVGQPNVQMMKGLLTNPTFRVQAKYMLLLRCLGLLKTVMTILTPEEIDWFELLPEHAMPLLM